MNLLWDKTHIQVNLAISKSKGMEKYFELSEVLHKQNVMSPKYDVHVQFLQIFPFNLFYFYFNSVIDHTDAKALARDEQYGRNGDFLKITVNREMVKMGYSFSYFRFFFKRINKHKIQTKLYK